MVVTKKKPTPAKRPARASAAAARARKPRAAASRASARPLVHEDGDEHAHDRHPHVDVRIMPDEKRREHTMVGVMAGIITLIALGIASYNITLAYDLRKTSESLYDGAILSRDITAPRPAIRKPVVTKQDMPVLWSTVTLREGERESLEANLVAPLLADAKETNAPWVAMMVERKNAASRVVNVRLWDKDGAETSYLWPTTHADENGMWIPELPVSELPTEDAVMIEAGQ